MVSERKRLRTQQLQEEDVTKQNTYMTAERWRDGQYGAAFHIFMKIGRGTEYVVGAGIEKAALLEAAGRWSHGEQIMVKVALDLFDPGCVAANGHRPANVGDLAGVLDSGNFKTVVEAIQISRGVRRARP
jgi:hypothetical protein